MVLHLDVQALKITGLSVQNRARQHEKFFEFQSSLTLLNFLDNFLKAQ